MGTALERGYTVERDPATNVPVTVTDTDGRSTSSTYDEFLQPTSTTYASGGQSRTKRATYGDRAVRWTR